MQNPERNESHQQLIQEYDATMLAVYQDTHKRLLRCIAQGKPLVGVRESSHLSGIRKIACIAVATAAVGYGANLYIQNHGLTFGESAPTGAVNIAEGYAPPPEQGLRDTVISDHDKAAGIPKPVTVIPVSEPKQQVKGCSPKLTGAALAWCKKTIAPLSPEKQTSIEQIIKRGHNG